MAKLKTQFNDLVSAPDTPTPSPWIKATTSVVDGNLTATLSAINENSEVFIVFNIQSDAMGSMYLIGKQLFDPSFGTNSKHTSATWDTIDEVIIQQIVGFNQLTKLMTIISIGGIGGHEIYYR